jgi:predicted permease
MRNEVRGDLHGALSRSRTGGIGGSRGRLERGLVVVEVALAMLIASGATLLVRSVGNLYAIHPGIDVKGLAVVDSYSNSSHTNAQRRERVDAILQELRVLPGVKSAAASMKGPLRGKGDSFGITIDGAPQSEETNTYFRIVTPEYFETVGYKLRSGRTFQATDQPTQGEISIVVNQALAEKYFPGQDPIGKTVRGGFNVVQRIIGVVENAAEADLTDERTPVRYYLHQQVAWFSTRATFMIRATNPGEEVALLDAARSTVNKVAPDFAVQEATTMSRIFDIAVGPARQIMSLLALLSSLALLLGAVGIYGVISHFAQRRMRDWAIRVALGLPGRRVISKIVGQGVALVLIGVAFGAIGTLALARLLTSFLYGVSTVDPIAFATASASLLIAGMIAAFIPARRAGSVDPALVLREDA